MSRVKTSQKWLWLSPLTAYHDIVPWLVPEVITKWGRLSLLLPSAKHIKWFSIKQKKSTFKEHVGFQFTMHTLDYVACQQVYNKRYCMHEYWIFVPFAFPSESPMALIIISPLAKQWEVWSAVIPVLVTTSSDSITCNSQSFYASTQMWNIHHCYAVKK